MEVNQSHQRVVIIGPAHPFRGGIADTNEAMARAFQRAGHEVDLVTFTVQYPDALFPGKTQLSQDPAPQGLTIHRWIHSYNPLNWFKAAEQIKKLTADVVIIRFWIPFMGPCLGTIGRKLMSSARVVGITDNVIPHESRFMDGPFTRYFMKSCHAFMSLSKAVEKDLHSLTNLPVSHFPHPINDQLGDLVSKEQARANLGLEVEGRYLLFFGFIRRYKGLDLILEAMADERLVKRGVRLIIAGESYDDFSEYQQIIDRKDLNDRVVVHNRFIPGDEVASFFCAADLVTQTYRSATQSGITQMALHFNTPALVTRVGGLEEFVIEEKTGLFADVDSTDIATQIDRFFDMDARQIHDSIIEEKKRFSWDAFVEHFVSFTHDNFDA